MRFVIVGIECIFCVIVAMSSTILQLWAQFSVLPMFQDVDDVLRRGESILGLFFEEFENRRLEIGILIESRAQALWRHEEVFGNCDVNRIAIEWGNAREHFVGDAPHRIEVGRWRDDFVFELLRRHISRRSRHIVAFRCFARGARFFVVFGYDLGDAKVEHLDEVAGEPDAIAEHDIGGFEIAMDKPIGMRFDERLEDLDEDLNRDFGRERMRFVEQIFELFARDEFHRDIGQALGRLAYVVEEDGIGRV